ncbi:MAG: tRNA (guanosine(46)-N7)-methyltransferase TrmB [Candidatus Thioglobus sp.]|nr:tRNA (guanosine(46)-N7)-methyltransferase TrmB [Candidatus Thioglobus sp.]
MRKIQSFVRRAGRLTLGQKSGLNQFWVDFGVNISQNKLDLQTLFSRPAPVILEIGFGNGDSLLEMAVESPQTNFLGVEVYAAGVGRLINEAQKRQISNLKIIKDDGVEVLKNNIIDNSLSGFQLFFPDPWHKKKHQKRRIINTEFLDLISRKLKPEATLHIATDWENYAQQMMKILTQHPHFKNTQAAHKYSIRPKHRPLTKFEKRGKRLGLGVWDLIFTNEK